MAQQEKGPKLFTVEEANQLLPQVAQILRQLRGCRDGIRKLEDQRAVEELSWLREDGSVSPNAQKEVARIGNAIEAKADLFEDQLQRLNALGIQLKDLEEGLVDFFAARDDALIYLCWKEGEERIRFWHDLNSGFSGRQPIETL